MAPGGFEAGGLVRRLKLVLGVEPTVKYVPALSLTKFGLVALASSQPLRFTAISMPTGRSEVATLHWWMGWNIQRALSRLKSGTDLGSRDRVTRISRTRHVVVCAHAELEVLDAEEEDEDPLEEEDEVEEDLDSEVLNVEEEDEEVVVLDSRSLVVDSSVVVVGVSVAVGDSPPPPPPVSVGPFGFWVLVGKSPPPPPPPPPPVCVGPVGFGVFVGEFTPPPPPICVGFWVVVGVFPPPIGFWLELGNSGRNWASSLLPLDFDSNSVLFRLRQSDFGLNSKSFHHHLRPVSASLLGTIASLHFHCPREDAELEIIGPELVLSVGSTLLVTPELDGCEDGPAKPVEWAAEEVCGLEDTGVLERVWDRDGGADNRIEPLDRTDEAPDCEDVAEPGAEDIRRVVECRTGDFRDESTTEEVRDSNKGAVIAEETDPVGPPDEAPYCDGVTDAADDILQEETDGSEAFFEDLWVKVNENRPDEFVKWAALDCKLKRTWETEISELMVVLGAVLSAGAVVGRGGFGVVGRVTVCVSFGGGKCQDGKRFSKMYQIPVMERSRHPLRTVDIRAVQNGNGIARGPARAVSLRMHDKSWVWDDDSAGTYLEGLHQAMSLRANELGYISKSAGVVVIVATSVAMDLWFCLMGTF
ncbi:hypothetical protein B0H13DRAFT_1866274 [Mycena leptocephala]|nr:hypothetical protein B0H13DRAFT_1866274 [Mycena leptocephala]